MDKKKKKILMISLLCVLFLGGGIGGCYLFTDMMKVTPVFEEQTIELGNNAVSTNVEDYIIARKTLLEKTQLDTSNVKVNEVGDYTITCSVNDNYFEYIIHVVDTTKPSITFINKGIYGTYNEYTLDTIASVSDISEITKFDILSCYNSSENKVNVNDNTFIVEDPGTYIINVVAEDCYGNVIQESTTIDVLESPHFVLLNDRQIRVGSEFDPSQFVYAVDKDGNDITNKIVIDENGFDYNTIGDYEITYSVTDDDNIVRNQNITISVGEFDENNYGFEDINETIDILREHNYFNYEPLEKDGTYDEIQELTSPTSISIKNKTIAASALVYKITSDKCYFITEYHCRRIFTKDSYCYLFNYNGKSEQLPISDVKFINQSLSELMMFSVPTDSLSTSFLFDLKEIYVNDNIYETLNPNDKVLVNVQEHGFLDDPNKDIIKEANVISLNQSHYETINMGGSFLTITHSTRGGCSGGPVFDYKGNWLGTCHGIATIRDNSGTRQLDAITRIDELQTLINRMNEL